MERGARNHYHTRAAGGGGAINSINRGSLQPRAEPDLVLQWGNRKRLRCVKAQRKDKDDAHAPENNKATAPTVRVDRRPFRVHKESAVLLRRASPTHHRVLRNSEAAGAMRGQQQANGVAAAANGGAQECSDEKKGGASSSGSEGAVWPSLTIALTTKEKEEDFLVFKGSRLPQRPKKRSKIIQRTLNLVSPGSWLCDLSLDRYEVREKKVSKKRPRGLKAMGNIESDSE